MVGLEGASARRSFNHAARVSQISPPGFPSLVL